MFSIRIIDVLPVVVKETLVATESLLTAENVTNLWILEAVYWL